MDNDLITWYQVFITDIRALAGTPCKVFQTNQKLLRENLKGKEKRQKKKRFRKNILET